MVVIAIIALLVAILMPTYRGAVAAADNASCKNNLYHIAQTLHSDTQSNAHISCGYNWLNVAMGQSDLSADMVWCQADKRVACQNQRQRGSGDRGPARTSTTSSTTGTR